MKPLYSSLKHIAFRQNACLLHDVIFYFCLTTVSSTTVKTPDSQLNYTFVQLTAEYKTLLNVEIPCAITVQRRVNYGNLMNIFVFINHVDYYSLSSSFPSEYRPSIKFIELGLWSNNTFKIRILYKERIPSKCILFTYIISKLYYQWINLFEKKNNKKKKKKKKTTKKKQTKKTNKKTNKTNKTKQQNIRLRTDVRVMFSKC